ncbi:hypothetical protein H1C71_019598, partial [Ictidomys tridecemlineatus]|uniref:PDZ domain-containing protein n=1 Tax=Ictidomys tridecemlineatus TaxID=43179 RepID=A0A287CTD1_ICTTR
PWECQLSKKEGQSYGFFLRLEKETDEGSSAGKSVLLDGDRVLRINSIFVNKVEQMQVVDLVRKSGNSLTLLVLGGDSYKKVIKKNQVDLKELGQSQKDLGLNDKKLVPVMNG